MFTTLTGLAALSFSIGGYFMKLSAGLTRLRPTVMVVVFFSIGTVLQTVAMRGEQMAITYIVVLGFEAISALALSMILLHESGSLPSSQGGCIYIGRNRPSPNGKDLTGPCEINVGSRCHEVIFRKVLSGVESST